MATPTAGARASRRAAARQVADAPVPTPASAPVAETLVDDDEADAAFGPEDVAPASEKAASASRDSQSTTQPSAPVRPASAQHGALALPMEDLTRKIDAGDLIMPKLRLSQAMSKANTLFATSKGTAGVGMGSWYVSSSGQNLGDTVYFIPVDMRKSRAMFVQGQGLMCRSFDLLQGEGDPGIACEGTYEERLTVPEAHRGCPLRLWNDKTPPKCGVTYNYPGYVIEDIENPASTKMIQVILQLRSASTVHAKTINTFVMNEGGGVWQDVILELGVEAKSNMKGTFYVPVVDFFDNTSAPEFARIKRRADAMARQMGSQGLRASIEDDGE